VIALLRITLEDGQAYDFRREAKYGSKSHLEIPRAFDSANIVDCH
jgi:hypothetical protein